MIDKLKSLPAFTWPFLLIRNPHQSSQTKPNIMNKLISVAVVATVASSLVGCAELQNLQSKPAIQEAEKEGWSILNSAAQAVANGGKMDSAWAVPVALNSISDLVKSTVSNEQAASLIQASVAQFATDPQLQHVGQDLAKAFISAQPQTAAEKQGVVVALSTGASNGLAQAQGL